jgi:nicotinate-nucleotide adenylyltransferase
LPKPNYTINTLTYLSEKFPTKKFSLLIGGDNIETFHKWKNYQKILENYRIYVYKRPGTEIPALSKFENADIIVPEVPQMEISSSMIRNAIKENKDVRFYMPAKAYDYIKEMGWFK